MKEKGNEESEIILHFVIIKKVLSKAGICKVVTELPYCIIFFFHTGHSGGLLVGCLGYLSVTLTSASAADAVPVLSTAMVWLQIHCSDAFIFLSWPAP